MSLSAFGPGKSIVDEMLHDGIDPTDEAAVADWTKAFNARPFKERDVILRGALPSGRADKGRRRLDQDEGESTARLLLRPKSADASSSIDRIVRSGCNGIIRLTSERI